MRAGVGSGAPPAESVDGLDLDRLQALLPRLQDIRHDLGKYICFEVRFAGPEPAVEVLRAALRADLLATRRQGSLQEGAVALWARLRPAELALDADLQAVDAAIAGLGRVDLEGSPAELAAAAALAEQVRDASQRLHRRARARLLAAGHGEDLD